MTGLPDDISSFHKASPPPSTRPQPAQALDSTRTKQDVDAIDLTDDLDHTTSSGTEVFGEPRRLWTEEAAFRKGPESRGKKRKSDEYMSDLLSPTKPVQKARSPDKPEDFHPLNGTRPDYSPSSRPVKNQRPLSPVKVTKRQSPVHSRKRRERVVADSDDDFNEDNDDLFNWIDEEDPPFDTGEQLYPVLPDLSPDERGEGNGSLKRKSPGPRFSPSPKKNALPSPRLRYTPIDNATNRQQINPHQLSPFPSIPSSQVKKDPKVVQFLDIPTDTLGRLTSSLKDTQRKTAEIVYEQAMEGHLDSELIAKNKKLISRIAAIEALQQQKVAYEACASEKEGLKNVLMLVISRGGDPQSMPEELAKSRSIAAEQDQIVAKILDLLPRADILDSTPNSSGVEIPQSGSPQLTRPPLPKHSQSFGTSNVDELVGKQKSPGNSPVMSPVRATVNNNASRINVPYPATRSFPMSTKENAMFGYDDPMLIEEDDSFTRTMGSPAPPADDFDEFDMDGDDEEMLEVAEHYEDAYPLPTSNSETQTRKVFAETSGNAVRAPSTGKQAIHNPLWHNHPWTKDVRTVLRDRFHLRGFRPNQLEAIDATLSGKDAFVLMPTGGGKSLCYQLPSVVASGSTKGVTVVVSPLLSLMQDQVAHMQRLNIKALLLNGETDTAERKWIMSTLSRPDADKEIELLYITPEMVNKSEALTRTLEKLNSNHRLARIVIDEAHCVSQWGHDFRPDYKELGEFRARLAGVPMMALTATATENVKVDVIHNLKMEGCKVFSQSFNRPNLTYEVRPKKKGATLLESIANTISGSYHNQCGIIYCLSRKQCEKVAADLRQKYKLKAAHYHAGMKAEEKAAVQRDWQSGKHKVIVATIAFGMGIDKPDVRFVIHHTIPKSLEGYYQETGRAGRDGKRSGCYLYYGYQDTATIKRMIDGGEGSKEQKARQRQMLRNVVQYCENKSDCRRVQILAYFNEYFRREECNSSCDNCKSVSTFELHDYSKYAADAIKIVRHFEKELEQNVTLLYCVDVFLGTQKKLKSPSHKGVPGYGKGASLGLGEAERLFYRLLGEEALYEKNVMNKKEFANQYIKLGRRAADFENGRRQMKLHVRISPNGKKDTARPMRGGRAADDYPQSTNVSSPIQSANHRRLAKFRYQDAQDDSSDDGKDSDGFEQIRVAGKPRRERRNKLGPPITRDPAWEDLEPLHRTVAEDFIYYAEDYCKNVSLLYSRCKVTGILTSVTVDAGKEPA